METLLQLKEEDFKELLPLIKDKNITDIDYNGYALWVTDLKRGRYRSSINLSERFVSEFTEHVADCVSARFNKKNSVLEAQTEDLRITITHESVAVTGRSICIRKSPREVRNDEESILSSGFCSPEILNFLKQALKARMNMAFCGEPGVGKTETIKFFTGFLPEYDRIITIEDTLELHLHEVYPGRDVEELLINEQFSYTDAIKHCLRKNPNWVILSEARSTEVKYLLEQWSTGVRGLTTLHLDDLRNLPDRLLNMMEKPGDMERQRNNIYEYVSIGVLIRRREEMNGETGQREIRRYIDQVAVYDRDGRENRIHMLLEDGKLKNIHLPESFVEKLEWKGCEKLLAM